MRITEVIESKVYFNVKNGRTASIYGCHPATTDKERADWIIKTVGWTWRLDNGTVGLCRVPAKTKEEAIEVMNKYNNRDWS